jgi:hypothetical protein
MPASTAAAARVTPVRCRVGQYNIFQVQGSAGVRVGVRAIVRAGMIATGEVVGWSTAPASNCAKLDPLAGTCKRTEDRSVQPAEWSSGEESLPES